MGSDHAVNQPFVIDADASQIKYQQPQDESLDVSMLADLMTLAEGTTLRVAKASPSAKEQKDADAEAEGVTDSRPAEGTSFRGVSPSPV